MAVVEQLASTIIIASWRATRTTTKRPVIDQTKLRLPSNKKVDDYNVSQYLLGPPLLACEKVELAHKAKAQAPFFLLACNG